MKYLMSEILEQPIDIIKLEAHSFEINIYLVKLHSVSGVGYVYDDNGKPKRFNNSQNIRDAFECCDVETAVLVHESPYDEMIGNPNKPEKTTEMPFSILQPY